MREEITDEYGRLAVVESGDRVDLGTVWLSADDDSADWGAEPTLRLPVADARKLAAALLRAADEAESGVSEEARLRLELAAVDDALREAGIDYPLGARGVRDLANLFKTAKETD